MSEEKQMLSVSKQPSTTPTIDDVIAAVEQYHPKADFALIRHAYAFGAEAHKEQKRRSGIPYISHPLAVAYILTQLKMDAMTIASALLHDTIEDTEVTAQQVTERFGSDVAVLVEGVTKLNKLEFASREAAARSPLAERLFGVPGVTSVFYGSDFVTVTKDDSDWQHLKPAILGAIMEHYMSGAPLLADGSAGSDDATDEEGEFFNEDDAETVATIKDLIETRVRPAVAGDGGDITFRGFKDGIVYLNMKGSCSGCPSSTATLQHGIQNLLRHFVPDVVEVRPV